MYGPRQPRITIGRPALRIVASLLVAVGLFMLNAAPAPAADQDAPTTPAALTAEHDPVSVEDPTCEADTPGEFAPTEVATPADPGLGEPTVEVTPEDPTASATETADIETDPLACAAITPEAVEPDVTPSPSPVTTPPAAPSPEPTPTPGADRSTDGAIDTPPSSGEGVTTPAASPSPTPDSAEAVAPPVDDGDGEGIGESHEDVPPADPFLIDPPPGDESSEAEDPMLFGLAASDVVADAFVDPLLIGFTAGAGTSPGATAEVVSAAAADNAKKPVSGITVDTISSEGTIVAGGQTSYLFRLVNTANNTEHFWIDAVTTGIGWTTAIFAEDGTVLTGTQSLKGGQELRILVVVTAPLDALAGDAVTTTVTAVDTNGNGKS